METKDLKDIWTTLAENKLIDKELAQEKISEILNKKRGGLISRMKKKVLFDYILYLTAFIIIPIAILFVHIVLKKPSPALQIAGVFAIECYFLIMFLRAKRKLNLLNQSDNTGSLKDSLINFRTKFLKVSTIEKKVMLIFSYFIIILAITQYFIYKGTIFPIRLSDKNVFIPIFLILMLVLLPFILNFEYRIRFSQIIKDMNETIDELNSEI